MTKLRVLVGCEFSGIVRDAFRALGHDAYSCDLLPSEADPKFHFQKDVLELLCVDWDLLIAHPSCTYLCNSGVRWLYGGKGTVIDPARWQQMVEAAAFFKALLNAPIARIAIENPIPHRYALERIGTSYSGKTRTSTYLIWVNMWTRCTNSKVRSYKNYGGRGISVSPRWKSFENFLADMGERPKGLTLERKNNNGNYEPANCKWADWFEQAANRRPAKKKIALS